MRERFMSKSASMLILTRIHHGIEEILLQKRQNTGYKDGYYDLAASGHVDEGESALEAMIRESKEELNIYIKKENLHFSSVVHNYTKASLDVYYNFYFHASLYEGELKINEPNKCSELKWFNIYELPDNLIEYRKQAIQNYLNKIYYNEYGWE